MTASANFFDSASIFLIFFATVVFILAFFEAGFRVGRYMRPRYAKKTDAALGPMVGSTLAMLAFVLAITFSMTASRFDQRRQNLLAEVNAIEIAYLRADFIAEPQKTNMKRYLLQYVDTRLLGAEKGARESALSNTQMLHKLLWAEIKSAVEENPTRLSGMVIQSVNDIITIHEKRMTYAIRQRVPLQIWFALYAIAAFAMVAAGSQAGLSESRRMLQVIPTALGFAVLMTLIIDLDRPADVGLTKVSQTAMMDLREKMDIAAR